jgi:hypothetical protein
MALLHELSDDNKDEDDNTQSSVSASDPKKLWLKEYNQYVDTWAKLVKRQSMVQW